jgi:uncharacterized membrane protein YhiD involved in acid resistance
MTVTAATILFLSLVNILLILSVIVLFARQNRLMDMEKRQRALLLETEESVMALLAEIKDENDRFLKQIMQVQEKGAHIKEEQQEEKNVHAHEESVHETVSEEAKEPDEMDMMEEEEPLFRQVQRLEARGMTINEIARTLGKGKTEIRLARKFQQRA